MWLYKDFAIRPTLKECVIYSEMNSALSLKWVPQLQAINIKQKSGRSRNRNIFKNMNLNEQWQPFCLPDIFYMIDQDELMNKDSNTPAAETAQREL